MGRVVPRAPALPTILVPPVLTPDPPAGSYPETNFADAAQLAALEKLLPPREQQPIPDGEIEECVLDEFDPEEFERSNSRAGRSAYEEDEGHGGGGPGVQCASQ